MYMKRTGLHIPLVDQGPERVLFVVMVAVYWNAVNNIEIAMRQVEPLAAQAMLNT